MEYILWGIVPNKTEEQILLSKFDGLPINSKELAINLKKVLEIKYKCNKVRIQEIDLTNGFTNDFINTL